MEASQKLWEYFSTKPSFLLEENFKEIIPISENEDSDKAGILAALEDMEKVEVVKIQEYNDKKYYILKRPIESYDQTVTITYQTAYMIGTVVNEFCEKIKDHTDACDLANLTEKDLRNVALVANHNAEYAEKIAKGEIDTAFGDDINFGEL